MITLAVARWAVTLVHGCPITGFFLEEANQHNFYWDMVAIYNRDLIEDTGYEGSAHTEFSNTDESYLRWIYHAFETRPCLREELRPEGEVMGYIREVDRNHARTKSLANPKVLLSLLDVIKVPNVASRIVDSLNVKSAASLGSTSKIVRKSIGYDPFRGGSRGAMLGAAIYLGAGDRKTAIELLALYAFNHIYDAIQPHVKSGPFQRVGDRAVREISTRTKYGANENSLVSTNCLAITTTSGGVPEGAVNFVYNDRSLLENRELHLDPEDYRTMKMMHGELRLMQRQHDRGFFRPIYVDKYCCPFCAVQFIVMGLIRFTPGATANTALRWYTFSPYVIYFKTRRVQMWGQDVEDRFAKLTVQEKSYFLYKLATSCSVTKHSMKEPMYSINL
ncbi:hypothetical protein [Trinickia sp. EG282A]|uniref:hypothetical protein n=1 Tax=Trinickia sp. EG282A TaxID=3237013 RepID=UPI0034D2FE80